MNKLLSILIPIFLLVNFGFTFPDKPVNNTRVVDQTNKLTKTQVNNLNARIKDIENTNKAQVAIVIVPTLQDESIETAANEVFRKWGIGDKKLNNGVLLMMAMKERKMRIEVGYGLEGTLTDSYTQSIIQAMKSPLRQGNLYAATGAFVGSINTKLIKAVDVEKSNKSTPVSDSIPVWLFSLSLAIGLFVLYMLYSAFKPKKKTEPLKQHYTSPVYNRNKYKTLYESDVVMPVLATSAVAATAGYAAAKLTENKKKKKAANDDSYSSSGYSSWSSSSSSDYSSGSSSDSGSSFDSFGGGDSGGGGSSGDW